MSEAHVSCKTAFVTSITETSDTDLEGIGTLRWSGEKAYRWVKNDEESALTIGDVVCHVLSEGQDLFGTVKLPLTANLSLLAGVSVSAIPAGEYGWIQVLGVSSSVNVSGATNATWAAGSYLKAQNAKAYLTLDTTSQPAYSRNIQLLGALALDTEAAAAVTAAYINCL